MPQHPVLTLPDASKFLSQSQIRKPSNLNDAPLFYSTADFASSDDEDYIGNRSNNRTAPPTAASVYNNFGSRFLPSYINPTVQPGPPPRDFPVSEGEDEDYDEEQNAFFALEAAANEASNNRRPNDSVQSSLSTIGDFKSSSHNGLESIQLHSKRLNTAVVADDDEPPDDLKVDNPLPGVSVPFNPDDFASGPSNHTNRAARSQTLEQSQVPPEVQFPTPNMPMYDAVWGKLYLGFVACMFATSLLVWLKTSVPTSVPLGDTMYTLLKKSAPYLFWETLLAVAISAGWVFVMKRNSTALFYVSIVSVPFVLLGLFLYPLIMSYRSGYGGNTSQDKMMRWTSLIPLVLAGLWINFIYKGRKAINRSLGIIQLACKILADFPPLLLFNCAVVGVFIVATWIWFGMFARVFLRGHTVLSGGIVSWVLDPRTWALGAFYIMMYMWSWGVLSGIQRGTTSGVVQQWYFHRHVFPQPTPSAVTYASFQYSIGTHFGTICFSSLVRLLVRAPLFILPARAVGFVQMCIYHLVSASVISLTNPLALTNAVITSQGLVNSAHTISGMRYLDHGHNDPVAYNTQSWAAYRLSKMLLLAARALTALLLGFGTWVHASCYTDGGSLYGYMAGLIAGFIGWFVLGATEGSLSIIVDSAFVCFAIDNAGQGGHCTEADRQFGGASFGQ